MFLYSLLFYLLWPLGFLAFVWRYGLRRTLRGLPERFGWGGPWPAPGALWVHAASVGEVRAAEPFLRALPARFPGRARFLTTTTTTGRDLAVRLALADTVRLAPVDRPGPVRRVLARAAPRAVVLVETELWPHWLAALKRDGVPAVVVNGRISERAFPLYMRVRGFLSPLLASLERVGVQGPAQAARFLQLGARSEAVSITGNLKHDLPLPDPGRKPEVRRRLGLSPEDPVIVAGSTREGEEELLGRVFRSLAPAFPSLRLILAPRHPERAPAILRGWREAGPTVLRSAPRAEGWRVMVVDTLGELAEIYGAATAAVVGGSLAPRGGQNPLEPARWGVPVVWGPHMENFREIAALFRDRGAALEVKDEAGLEAALRELLSSPERRSALGQAARAAADLERGAVRANLDLLAEALDRGRA